MPKPAAQPRIVGMKAIILAIGDELVLGQTIDTNSAYLSAKLAERANNPVMRAMMIAEKGLFVPQQGAVPIKQGDELLGAIGVSGASSKDDEIIALAALAAF